MNKKHNRKSLARVGGLARLFFIGCALLAASVSSAEEVIFQDGFDDYADVSEMMKVWTVYPSSDSEAVGPELVTVEGHDGKQTQVCSLPENGLPIYTRWPGLEATDEEPVIFEAWLYEDGFSSADRKGIDVGYIQQGPFAPDEPLVYLGQQDWRFYFVRGVGSSPTDYWTQTGIFCTKKPQGWRFFRIVCDSDGISCFIDHAPIRIGEIPYSTKVGECWNGIVLGSAVFDSDVFTKGAAYYDDVRVLKGRPPRDLPKPDSNGQILQEDFEVETLRDLLARNWDVYRIDEARSFLSTEQSHTGDQAFLSTGMCGQGQTVQFDWQPVRPSRKRPLRIGFWLYLAHDAECQKGIRCTTDGGAWFEWGVDTESYIPQLGRSGTGKGNFCLRTSKAWKGNEGIYALPGLQAEKWHHFVVTMDDTGATFNVDGSTHLRTGKPLDDLFSHLEVGSLSGDKGTVWFDDITIGLGNRAR